MNILFKFPNLYPGTKTTIVLKQPKSDDTIRDVDVPQSVLNAFLVLKGMQDKLKKELGSDGYMDYNLTICRANGRPIMTEHLNKRFKEILTEMKDPDIDPQEVVSTACVIPALLPNSSCPAAIIIRLCRPAGGPIWKC